MNLVKKIFIKLREGGWFPFYNSFYERVRLDKRLILLESRGGNALEGNILWLCKELSKEFYADYRLMISVKNGAFSVAKKKKKLYRLKNIQFVRTGSIRYYYYLAKAGYLINDTSFPGRFVKKEGQIYLNTWHGTPLKCMGKDNRKEIYSMGNVMRNLLQTDYLIFPNSYMEEKMIQAYQLSNLYKGTILREGYPRNSIFFSEASRDRLRHKLAWKEKQIIVYMPTFRGNVEKIDNKGQIKKIERMLELLDGKLQQHQIMYVKLHPLMRAEVNIKNFHRIKIVPEQYDINDFLNASDVLVTDYSSVLYDYANTDRPVILFTDDEQTYSEERGIYEAVEQYPFQVVKTVEALLSAIQHPQIADRKSFREKYCTYENEKAAERICRHIFLGEQSCQEYHLKNNGKKNILLYAGDLDKNGITTALLNMLSGLDKERFNYYISFRRSSLQKAPERLEVLPEDCGIIPLASEMNMDLCTMVAQALYLRKGVRTSFVQKRLDISYRREWKKHYGGIEFRHVIHYNGYERYIIALLQRFEGKRTIWVHNDMRSEIKEKGNQNLYQLQDAYRSYDHVVVVSPDIYDSTCEISGREDNIKIIGNCHDYRRVLERADMALEFEDDTEATVSVEELKQVLDGAAPKFINIGRYSVEKGHSRLIAAFEKYWMEHRETYLIIIGGTGSLYSQTVQQSAKSKAADHIILIKSMKNPMPILKKCQLFILSSLYEGLGLVMLEADTLGVPVIACNVVGPSGFVETHGGVLVDDSEDGIYKGMLQYAEWGIACMNVDYEEMNRQNVQKCEQLW